MMKIEITRKYLIFPVNTSIGKKRMTFLKDGSSVYALNIRLDNLSPDYEAYIDMSRFMGETLELVMNPYMKVTYREADEIDLPDLDHEPTRPQIHFSPKIGWNNDPNGMIYVGGTYHMFYQYNPTEPKWDNMHWGHAVSPDMIHWEEKDVVLFPSDDGMKFSGSAIVDEQNLLGLQQGDTPTVVLYHTVTEPSRQCIAYSTDNLKTVIDAAETPIIPNLVGYNRDPKVVYCDELKCYVMALYMEKDIYALFSSADLRNWKKFQELHLPGDSECPDLFVLTDANGNRKWCLMGASDKYIVGEFKNGHYVQTQPVMSLHYGNSAYAGQTYSNLPNNRVVRVVWDSSKRQWPFLHSKTNGQMGIPTQYGLEEVEGTYYITATPVEEFACLYESQTVYESIKTAKGQSLKVELQPKPHQFRIKGKWNDAAKLDVTIFGCKFQCDFVDNALKFDDREMPISVTNGDLDLTIIVDTCSFEIFTDNGKAYMAMINGATICDWNLPWMEVSSDMDYELNCLEVTPLRSIWEE